VSGSEILDPTQLGCRRLHEIFLVVRVTPVTTWDPNLSPNGHEGVGYFK